MREKQRDDLVFSCFDVLTNFLLFVQVPAELEASTLEALLVNSFSFQFCIEINLCFLT